MNTLAIYPSGYMSYNLTKVAYLYFYRYKIFAIKTTWKWICI